MRAYIKIITLLSYSFTVQDPHVLPSKVFVYSAVLRVYKVLVWPTLLLCEWKSHPLKMAGLSLVTEANAPAWDPSCNNRNSFNGPDTAAKITDGSMLGEKAFKHQTHCRGFVLCLLTCQTQRQEHFSHITT